MQQLTKTLKYCHLLKTEFELQYFAQDGNKERLSKPPASTA